MRRNCASRSGCWRPSSVLRLACRLIAQLVQQPVHRALADPMAFSPQLLRQARRAAACPAQRSLRVAPCKRVEQMFQRLDQTRVALRRRLATAARDTNPRTARPRCRRRGRIQFSHACPHRAARQPGRLGNPCNSAAANGAGFRRGPEASRAFVQQRPQHVELSSHRLRYGVHEAEHSRAIGVTGKLFWRESLLRRRVTSVPSPSVESTTSAQRSALTGQDGFSKRSVCPADLELR